MKRIIIATLILLALPLTVRAARPADLFKEMRG